MAAPVRIDNQRWLLHGQDEGRFTVTVAAFQCPAPGRKYILVNSLESHGKVSDVRCRNPALWLNSPEKRGVLDWTIARRSLFVQYFFML